MVTIEVTIYSITKKVKIIIIFGHFFVISIKNCTNTELITKKCPKIFGYLLA